MLLLSFLIGLTPSPAPQESPVDKPRSAESASPAVLEDLEMLRTLLRLRESRIAETERMLSIERDINETAREQRGLGLASARGVEIFSTRLAAYQAQLVAREAERDEIVVRLAQLERELNSSSPEPDRDELRARLDDEVQIREAQLRAREARLREATLEVTSEEHSREQFLKSMKLGYLSPLAMQQSSLHMAEATTWKRTMEAERDLVRVALGRAERRRDQFDDPDASDPTLELESRDNLVDRVESLEHLVDVLRDEMYHVQWEIRGMRNQQHAAVAP